MQIKPCLILILMGAGTSVVSAQPPEPHYTDKETFVRPYKAPEESTILERRIAALEAAAGETRFDHEYSLPITCKLRVKIIFRKDNVIDKEKSGMFFITHRPRDARNRGTFTISSHYPQPRDPDRDKSWYVKLNQDYGYGFREGTPKDLLISSSLEQKTWLGEELEQENIAFAYEEINKKFSIVVKVKAVPMTDEDKMNNTTRIDLPEE